MFYNWGLYTYDGITMREGLTMSCGLLRHNDYSGVIMLSSQVISHFFIKIRYTKLGLYVYMDCIQHTLKEYRVYHIFKEVCFRLKTSKAHTNRQIRSYGRTHLLWMFQHSISQYQRALKYPRAKEFPLLRSDEVVRRTNSKETQQWSNFAGNCQEFLFVTR